MARTDIRNTQANEAISKFKLLSAYGGPGSLVHTAYGSILISCIEEWGFLRKIKEINEEAKKLSKDPNIYVRERASLSDIFLSNDERLISELKGNKRIPNLSFLILVPNFDVDDRSNEIEHGRSSLAINSEFFPKIFFNRQNHLKNYHQWHQLWTREKSKFFPPKYIQSYQVDDKAGETTPLLKQDNLVVICKNGHLSDIPWAKFLRWRTEQPHALNEEVDLYNIQFCCNNPDIQITETTANATGFDGKWLRCNNLGCAFTRGTSLKGIMSLKIVCPGHKPWESSTGESGSYSGLSEVRRAEPKSEDCRRADTKLALTTGNNLYFSRVLTSIYMPPELFESELTLQIRSLEIEREIAMKADDFERCINIREKIKILKNTEIPAISSVAEEDRDIQFRFQEFKALTNRTTETINISKKDLLVMDVTTNLDDIFKPFFQRILRVDKMKITSAQLDFSRVEPYEAGSLNILNKNIFRSRPEEVIAYPVVENFGEGIFFAFDNKMIKQVNPILRRFKRLFDRPRNKFATGAKAFAVRGGMELYMVHTFSHLIMRELEFRCGYPTASLSERLFVSNDEETSMYGCLIYTAEGAEGSMGGVIAQTRGINLNNLIRSALTRATICNSDPLCWRSDGQGLFELNMASCFSCSLVSETSCEHRNIYLDRQVLIDLEIGLFRNIMDSLK